jgi:D-amino-acid oxidase
MKSATVIGSGIIGLTTALKLQKAGYAVTIVAKEKFSETLSSKVGAIWFPFQIEPLHKAHQWAALSYSEYEKDQTNDNGVSFIPFTTVYNTQSNTNWISVLPSGSVRIAKSDELLNEMTQAHISTVPLVEPLHYLPYLFNRFKSNNGTFIKQQIYTLEEASNLNNLVINCSGLGARELCNDNDLKPMRGQILRCAPINLPSYADSTTKGALTYLINRTNDCIIGGTDYENDWNLKEDPTDTELILNRFSKFNSTKNQPEILEEVVGLRPKRPSIRFELDKTYQNIFHNYGHGGAGFTVAWGCAIELVKLQRS